MDEMIIEKSADGRHRVRLEIDQDSGSFNPRKNDVLVTYAVTVPHSHYADVLKAGPLVDEWDRIKDRSDAVDLFTRWARTFHGAVVTTHTPERGPNSVWYILPEQIKEIGCTPEEALRADIEEYQTWAEGEVYGYIVEKAVDWKRADDPDADDSMTTWEEVEDCWGYIGWKDAEESARHAFEPYKNKEGQA